MPACRHRRNEQALKFALALRPVTGPFVLVLYAVPVVVLTCLGASLSTVTRLVLTSTKSVRHNCALVKVYWAAVVPLQYLSEPRVPTTVNVPASLSNPLIGTVRVMESLVALMLLPKKLPGASPPVWVPSCRFPINRVSATVLTVAPPSATFSSMLPDERRVLPARSLVSKYQGVFAPMVWIALELIVCPNVPAAVNRREVGVRRGQPRCRRSPAAHHPSSVVPLAAAKNARVHPSTG